MKWFYAAFGSCLLLVNGAFLLGVQGYPGIGREHGPMENFQAICLLLAALIFYICQRRVLTRGGSRLLWSLALFCATVLLLEFDTRHFGWPLLTYVTNGWIRDVWLALLWLFMSWVVLRRWSSVWSSFQVWIVNSSGRLMLVAGFFWGFSLWVEGAEWANMSGKYFLEELMEVNGVLLMLGAALLSARVFVVQKTSPKNLDCRSSRRSQSFFRLRA